MVSGVACMIGVALFVLSALLFPTLLFLAYPLALRVLARVRPFHPVETITADVDIADVDAGALGRIGMVTVSNRVDDRLEAKVREFLEHAARIHASPDSANGSRITELFIGFDGALPEGPLPPPFDDSSLRWIEMTPAQGKNIVLARIHAIAEADVLVFTDVDSRVDEPSLEALLSAFNDPGIGAVTGRRRIVDDSRFGEAQAGYSALDSGIRMLEMRCFGSVTSCDGKLYAVRRSCIGSLPDSVTDDLFTGLGAVVHGKRLVFEPGAAALIGRPARDIGHELERRRRVTCRGLATLWHRRELLAPWRYGLFAIALFINKVLRRVAVPCALVALLFGLLILLLLPGESSLFGLAIDMYWLIFIAGLLFAAGVAVVLISGRWQALAYLVLGLLGMSLGVYDYLRGRRVSRWVPRKQAESTQAESRPATAPSVDESERS